MLKKNLSSLSVRRFVEESQILVGSRFQKAYQLDHGSFVMRFNVYRADIEPHAGREGSLAEALLSYKPEDKTGFGVGGEGRYTKADLFFHIGGYLFFTPHVMREMPKTPSPYAMMLRKRLRNRVLKEISQVGMDRVVVLTFSGGEEDDIKLYLELFGDGNLIMVRGGIIEAPYTSRSWASRTVKRGEEFSPPPSGMDPLELTLDGMKELVEEWKDDVVRFLIRKVNLPPIYAEEICFRSYLDKGKKVQELTEGEIESLFLYVQEVLNEVRDGKSTHIHYDRERPVLMEPALMGSFFDERDRGEIERRFKGGDDLSYSSFASFSLAVESSMFEADPPPSPGEVRREKGKSRIERMYGAQVESLEKREEEAGRYHRLAEALYTDYQRIEMILTNFDKNTFEEPGEDIKEFLLDRNGKGGRIRVDVKTEKGMEEALLDIGQDINGNAELLYALSKRSRKKAAGIKKALEITRGKVRKVEKEEEKEARKPPKLRRFWFETFRWAHSSEGVLMIGGRDAKMNERIVKKYLRDADFYSHADIQGSPSVVLRVEKGDEVTDISREEATHFSVLFSKAFNAKVGSERGYWVLPDQVSRSAQSGEFLPKGSFMIRGKKNFVDKLPLMGGLGITYIQGVPKAMFGPESAVIKNCAGPYYRIRPGRTKKTEAARAIAYDLGAELDQVVSVLPAGDMEYEKVKREE
ncbi:MAG: NFACT family protein [Thermoplasmata archaeon]|nr:NFACT family protein [Thermoplasmata archaeon]